MNDRGAIVLFVLILALATGLFGGAKLKEYQIRQTMVCHAPGEASYFPSMSVPNYDRSGR